jgi:hypothetical protein
MKTIITMTTTLAAALILVSGYSAVAQVGAHDHQNKGATTQEKTVPPMEMCKKMTADMEKGKADMKDMDAKLDGLVRTMDSAKGENKVNAIASVIKELVSQRSMMRSMKEKMDAKMMAHMMEHMKMQMKSDKMDCPMMKGMMGG